MSNILFDRLFIFDNKGTAHETFDRYTVVIDSNVYSMSLNPLSPAGINQYCFTIDKSSNTKDILIKNRYGSQIDFDSLPPNVKKAIKQRISK